MKIDHFAGSGFGGFHVKDIKIDKTKNKYEAWFNLNGTLIFCDKIATATMRVQNVFTPTTRELAKVGAIVKQPLKDATKKLKEKSAIKSQPRKCASKKVRVSKKRRIKVKRVVKKVASGRRK